jgi:hypothetical protein
MQAVQFEDGWNGTNATTYYAQSHIQEKELRYFVFQIILVKQ